MEMQSENKKKGSRENQQKFNSQNGKKKMNNGEYGRSGAVGRSTKEEFQGFFPKILFKIIIIIIIYLTNRILSNLISCYPNKFLRVRI